MRPERFRRLRAVLSRRQPDLTLLAERVHKPRNLSAILRTCDAVGILDVHAVPADEGLRLDDEISASAADWLRVHPHGALDDAVRTLRDGGFRIVAAHPGPDASDYRRVDYTGPTALLVGTELYGVSDEALTLADQSVTIPMAGMVRSLNVSVATALLLYEAYRQREEAGLYEESRLEAGERDRVLFEWAYPRLARIYRERGEAYPELGPDGELPTGDGGGR